MLEALKTIGAALLLTAAVEAAAAWLAGLRALRAQGALLLVNIVTNPALNILIAVLARFGVHSFASPFDPLLIALECAVAALEAWLLHAALALPAGRSALVSIAANAASYLAGVFMLW